VVSAAVPTFLDLPDDVLLLIFEHLTVELVDLATLSRRLQLLALPAYLTCRGISNTAEFTKITLTGHAHLAMADISALHLSHSKSGSTIQHLHCTITINPRLFVVFQLIERLRFLVFSLITVVKFTIELTNNGFRERNIGMLAEKWGDLFGSLLGVITKRSCASLAIRRGLFLTSAFATPQMPLQDQSSLLKLWRTDLNTLSIDSTMLYPPFLRWTVSTLNHSKITNLTITSLFESVSRLLPHLAPFLPALTDLHIEGSSVRPVEVLSFINKLPQLKSLTMSRSLSEYRGRGPYHLSESSPMLNLTNLSAPPPFILFLLDPAILPNLEFLTIFPQSERYPIAFLSRVSKRLEEYNLSITIAIDIPLMYMFYLNSQVHSLLAENARWGNPSTIVTCLKLSGVISPAHPISSPRWLSLFPNLLHITFEDRLSKSALPSTLRSLIDACPSLVTIHINGVYQPISR
jgi:hypothetical protein